MGDMTNGADVDRCLSTDHCGRQWGQLGRVLNGKKERT